jgi:hypothetical protein
VHPWILLGVAAEAGGASLDFAGSPGGGRRCIPGFCWESWRRPAVHPWILLGVAAEDGGILGSRGVLVEAGGASLDFCWELQGGGRRARRPVGSV